MENKNKLQRSLCNAYRGSSATIRPPLRILENLRNGHLVLSDLEVGQDEVYPLCKFLESSTALSLVQVVELNRSKGAGSYRHHRCFLRNLSGVNILQSAFLFGDCKLLRTLFEFISNSKKLHSIIIDSIPFPGSLFTLFGHCLRSVSGLRWLSISNVAVGDNGLRALTQTLSLIKLRVLVFDNCQLSDASCNYLATIVKTQEAQMDNLYWNGNLRSSPMTIAKASNSAAYSNDGVFNYYNGLLMLSVRGNNIQGPGLATLGRVLGSTYWLLGLDMAGNKISADYLHNFASVISGNHFFRVVLAHENPGFNPAVDGQLQSLTRNQIAERFHYLPKSMVVLLQRWVSMQSQYGFGPNGLSQTVPVSSSGSPTGMEGDFPGFMGPDDLGLLGGTGGGTTVRIPTEIAERCGPRDLEAEALAEMSKKVKQSVRRLYHDDNDDDDDNNDDELDLRSDGSNPNQNMNNIIADISMLTDEGPIRVTRSDSMEDEFDNRPPSRQSLRPRNAENISTSPFLFERQGSPVSPFASLVPGSRPNSSLECIASKPLPSSAFADPHPRKANRSKPKMKVSQSLSQLPITAGSTPRKSSPSNRDDFLALNVDCYQAKERIWSPTGHESRISLNKRAGEVLQDALTSNQQFKLRKEQEKYYDEATNRPVTAPDSAATNGRSKLRTAPSHRKSQSQERQHRSAMHSEVRHRSLSRSQDTKPRFDALKPTSHVKSGAFEDSMTKSKQITRPNEVQTPNSSKKTKKHSPLKSKSPKVASSDQLLLTASLEITKTMALFTRNIENVSAKLIAVCDGFADSMQQVALNMSHLGDTGLMQSSFSRTAPNTNEKSTSKVMGSTPGSSSSRGRYEQCNEDDDGENEHESGVKYVANGTPINGFSSAEHINGATSFNASSVIPSSTPNKIQANGIKEGVPVSEPAKEIALNRYSEASIEEALRTSLRNKLQIVFN